MIWLIVYLMGASAAFGAIGVMAYGETVGDNPWVAIGTSLYAAALAGVLWPVYLLILVITGFVDWLRRP